MDTPKMPPTPRRKPKELPVDDDPALPPIELPSAKLPLINFSDSAAGVIEDVDRPPLSGLQGQYADYTSVQLYELNQKLLDDSVPERPLIDDVTPMSQLREEYERGSDSFIRQIDWLIGKGFNLIRRTRGDGDCFYRCDVYPPLLTVLQLIYLRDTALAFAYIEGLVTSPDIELAVATSLSMLESTKDYLEKAGIQQLVYEDFYAEFVLLIRRMVDPYLNTKKKKAVLLTAFQSLDVSNSIVMYLRLLTSTQIRVHRADYEGFIVHPDTQEPMDVDLFCSSYVDPLDNVSIEALCRAMNLNLDVAYLNGSRSDEVDFIKIRHDVETAPPISLLYRPGHYDVLPRKV